MLGPCCVPSSPPLGVTTLRGGGVEATGSQGPSPRGPGRPWRRQAMEMAGCVSSRPWGRQAAEAPEEPPRGARGKDRRQGVPRNPLLATPLWEEALSRVTLGSKAMMSSWGAQSPQAQPRVCPPSLRPLGCHYLSHSLVAQPLQTKPARSASGQDLG